MEIRPLFRSFRSWLLEPVTLQRIAREELELSSRLLDEREELKAMLVDATAANKYLRAQLVRLRVSQAEDRRAGWEVMCFIPEEVLAGMRTEVRHDDLVFRIARTLVEHALRGIHRVRQQGKVTALVFAPLSLNAPVAEPRLVEAIFDKDGKFRSSGWDRRSEEQRVKQAAGCGGFGV